MDRGQNRTGRETQECIRGGSRRARKATRDKSEQIRGKGEKIGGRIGKGVGDAKREV
jgi:hypothetical protein